tara:strand:- start:45 stop:497 length:453 start_codon:yes stop_codon:yes gene_type:complete
MAIVRSAGTEIIRSAWFEDIDGSVDTVLIFGEQHHIYTVLNITVYTVSLQAVTNEFSVKLLGYDAKGGDTNQQIQIFSQLVPASETFVFSDKFSFNGHEPTDFTGPMDDAAKQNAIADQGSSVAQKLRCHGHHADDNFEVTVTYIDQNNA